MLERRIVNLREEFKKSFGDRNHIRIFNAPGRVNIIGEHTDYNGGLVLPVAINRSILAIGRVRDDRILNLKTMNYKKEVSCSLDEIQYREEDKWANYPKGVAWVLEKRGLRLKGADVIFEGNIPVESGLSSSAAIEVVSMITFLKFSNQNLPQKEIALLSRKAENEFIGVSCGIMDQFIATFGKRNHALFIDCKTLDYKLVPFRNRKTVLIVGNTKVRRGLANSEYNKRVKETSEGLEILKDNIDREDIEILSDISLDEFNKCREKLPSPIDKRCEHVIAENERVKQAVECLEKGNLEKLGQLLNASHYSLKDLYEVSCKELDVMVEAAIKIKGVWGARMTGAGFGGCIIALVNERTKEEFVEKVGREYQRKIGKTCEFYICKVENGAREI